MSGAHGGGAGCGSAILVGNFPAGTGYAWRFIADLWDRFSLIAGEYGLRSVVALPTVSSASSEPSTLPIVAAHVPDTLSKGVLRAAIMMRKQRTRVLYLTDRRYSSFAYGIYRLMGVRVIIIHDHSPGDRPRATGLRAIVANAVRRMRILTADLVLTVSPLISDRAIRSSGMPAKRVRTVQNGIPDVSPTKSRSTVRRELGLPEDALVAVCICRAHPYKRLDHMIEVARLCSSRQLATKLHFVHCGDGPDLGRLERLRDAAGLQERVHFLGYRSDTAEIVASADLAFHPSAGEAFSLAILEYMRAGLPVVVPSLPTVSQAVAAGVTGLIYEEGNLALAADQIIGLCELADSRRSLGHAGREAFLNSFTAERTLQEFDSALRGVLPLATRGVNLS